MKLNHAKESETVLSKRYPISKWATNNLPWRPRVNFGPV